MNAPTAKYELIVEQLGHVYCERQLRFTWGTERGRDFTADCIRRYAVESSLGAASKTGPGSHRAEISSLFSVEEILAYVAAQPGFKAISSADKQAAERMRAMQNNTVAQYEPVQKPAQGFWDALFHPRPL
jgi:hypothetical protein